MSASLRVLITGAGSGLGREMAVQLAHEGCRLALTGRRQAKLLETASLVEKAGGESLPLVGTVTELAAVQRHYAEIKQKWGGLDWVILNAGIGESLNARGFKAENVHRTLATNVGGAANWLEAVLPDMIASGSGTIAGIASIAAWRGLPNAGSYCASKAALVTLLESLRLDLRGTGVSVVTICPGFIKSELTARNEPSSMPYVLETSDGAKRIIDAIKAKKRLAHFPWQRSFYFRYVVRLAPPALYDWYIATFHRPLIKSPP